MNRRYFLFLLCFFFTSPVFGEQEVDTSQKEISQKNLKSEDLKELTDSNYQFSNRDLAARKKIKKSRLQRSKIIKIPKINLFSKKKKKPISLKEVAPPSSSRLYYSKGTDEAELEGIINEEINHLFKLLKRKQSADLALRLGSLYVEKSKIIVFKLQLDYEKKMVEFERGSRKSKPYLNLKSAELYNKKSLKVFESFRNKYPKHPRLDEVLFFLGFNFYQLSKFNQGAAYFKELEDRFPKSPYLYESWFQLGEHYFKKQQWKKSLKYYNKVARNKNGKFYFFALYKMAWCNYKRYFVTRGLGLLEKIIKEGHKTAVRNRKSQRFTFAAEATQDLVLFYTYSKKPPGRAKAFFLNLLDKKVAWHSLKKLAYAYRDTGNAKGVQTLFDDLIARDPTGSEAFDYKYQIVHVIYDFGTVSQILNEFQEWVKEYGAGSPWARANSRNKRLVQKSINLIEVTLRNYSLKNHQTFRISKNSKERTIALNLYKMYFAEFKKSKHASQIFFFYGELLFDSKKYIQAVKAYEDVIINYPNTKYIQPAYINQILALEKTLPSQKEINKIINGSESNIEFPDNIKAFIKVSLRYLKKFPNKKNSATVLYRVAVFYYTFNQYPLSAKYLEKLSDKYPNFKHIGSVGSLLLDIYNKSKNYKALANLATKFSESKSIDKNLLRESRFVLEQLSFKKAQDLSVKKEFKKSADLYYKFAKENPSGSLAPVAFYNAAINYEKIKDTKKAINMYSAVITYKSKKHFKILEKSNEFLPVLQERLGFYRAAANGYASYAKGFPKNSKAVDYWYNAGVIFDALNDIGSAIFSYNKYLILNKNNDRHEVLYLMGLLYDRNGKWSQAIGYYKRYLKSASSNKLHLIKASFRIADIYQTKLKNKSQAAHIWHKKTLALQKRLRAGISYGARSHFYIVKKIYNEFLGVAIPKQSRLQKVAVEKKIKLLKKLEKNLRPIIRYNEGEQIIASLSLIGLANQKMAESIYNAPVPKSLSKSDIKKYKNGIKKVITPYVKESVKSYELALNKSKEFKVYSEWLVTVHQGLASMEFKKAKFEKFVDTSILPETFDLEILDNTGTISKSFLSTVTTGLKYGVLKEDLKAIEMAIKSDKESEVLEAVSDVLNKDSNNVLAINSLAFFYLNHKKLKLSSLIMNRALSKDSKQPVLLNNLGIVALKYGDIRDAVTYFKKALTADSSYSISQANLATIFIKNYDYGNAFSLYKKSYGDILKRWSTRNIKTTAALNNYGVSLIGIKKWKTALSLFKKITQESSPRPKVLLNYAIVLTDGFKEKSFQKEAQEITSELSLYSKTSEVKKKLNRLSKRIQSRL